MSRYLLIDLIIISGPLLFSFWPPVRYYRRWPALLFAVATAGSAYLLWDNLVTARGHWHFNPQFLSGITFFSLPLEEYLFFLVVPFSCIFIYEVLRAFYGGGNIGFPKLLAQLTALGFFIAAALFHTQEYTVLALGSCGLFFLLAGSTGMHILRSRHYWLYILISYVPFLIFNGMLTSAPVVIYNPEVIWGIRVTTIPLEDFFYSFSMLSFYLMAYLFARDRKKRAS